VFSHLEIKPELKAEFQAQPHFRHFTYSRLDEDPIGGWLSDFDNFLRLTVEDLARLGPVSASDLIYVSGAQPVEFAAVTAWMGQLTAAEMPSVVVDFCLPPGFRIHRRAGVLEATPPIPARSHALCCSASRRNGWRRTSFRTCT